MKLKEQSNIFPDIFNKTQVKPKSKYKKFTKTCNLTQQLEVNQDKKKFPTIHNDAHFAVMNRKIKNWNFIVEFSTY